jgi:NAD(P)-dependent dehydrogenase (short-subunit alcohol dehydrogenase family)
MKPAFDFAGKVAIVSGGARGQGLSHAEGFARCGAAVAVFDTSASPVSTVPYPLADARTLEAAGETLAKLCSEVVVCDLDVSDEKAVATAVALVVERFGRIDIVVNNAGVNSLSPYDRLDAAMWHDVLEVNLLGTFWLIKHAAPHLGSAGGGRIINIASMAAFRGVAGQAHYAASKAAVVALSRCLAVELGPADITVNTVCPSIVVSPQTIGLSRASGAAFPRPGVLPGSPVLQPADVTDVVLWLASDGAARMTGEVLRLDQGSSL